MNTEPRILKTSECPSVSGKSILTYHIGCTDKADIQLRVFANTGAGFFSNEWLSLKAIEETLGKGAGEFTSVRLRPLLSGQSVNSSAFVLAILLHEGLVKRKDRSYVWADSKGFVETIKLLNEHKTTTKRKSAAKPKSAPTR